MAADAVATLRGVGAAGSRLRAIGRFRSDARGATAVEFGLVAMPFFLLLAAIVEVAFRIWATQNFDYALQKASRGLFTGAFQVTNTGQTDPTVLLGRFRNNLCNTGALMKVFDCQSIKLDVVLSSSYAGGSPPSPFDANSGNWNTSAGTQYNCPRPGAIVIVSAAAKLPVFFSFLKLSANTFADGSQLLQSTAVFRTEPYQVVSSTGCGS